MIFTERNITIRNDSATINAPVILYRGDKNVEVRFILIESPYKYSNRDSINIFESTDASYAQLVIKTPNDREPIFGDITAVGNNNVTFVIRHDMIDEIEEVGKYDFQIRLFDADQTSMATTPEVVGGFIIKEPIAKEDSNNNITNSAIVGSAVVTNDLEIPTFVANSYNKTTWHDGDVISKQKLNKMEVGIYETYELSKDKANKDDVFTMANMGQDIREAMTGGSVAVIGNQMVGHANLSKKIQNEIGYYETITGYTGETFGYAINGSNIAYLYESGGGGNGHIDFNVVSGDIYKIDITTAGTGSIKSVIFTDNDLKVISSVSMASTITNEIYDVTVPTGATKMLISYRVGKNTLIQKMNYYELATKNEINRLDNNIAVLNNTCEDIRNDFTKSDVRIFDNIKNQLEAYESIEYDEATYGYAIKSNIPYLYTNGGAGNSSTIITVTKSDIYRIEMTTAGTGSIKSIILTDNDDNVISFIDLTNTIAEETYNVEIPENSTKMYVSFRKGLCKIYKKAVAKIMIDTGEGEVPDFYKEHMANKIKTIQQLEMAHGGNGCTFAIITDIHWGSNKKYSPALVKEVMENTNCKFVINNGDSAFSSRGDHNTKENGVADLNAVRKLFNNATNNNFYCVKGNHDNNSTGSADDNPDYLLSPSEMYSLLVEKYDHKIVGDIENPTGLYYYFEDKKNKIRHIILDSFEDGQGEGVMSVKQMKWFCEKAVQFDENGWNICIYTHKPISPFETSDFSEVRGILNAIRYGTQYSKSYTDNKSETYNINVDFAGKGHTVMFVATGHSHIDTLKQDNNITYFKSVCDAGYVNAVEITDRKGVNSQSFDVVCINKNTKQINLVRIGCGNDRIFTYGENSSIIQNTDMTKK